MPAVRPVDLQLRALGERGVCVVTAADIDTDRIRRNYGLPCYHDHHPLWADFTEVLDEVDRLGAENADLRARLAEVEAECVQWNQFRDPNIDRVIEGVRAAAEGDDRG